MSNKTAFQKIAYFNNLIGNQFHMANLDQIKVQFEMILEEVSELQDAIIDYCQGIEHIQSGDYCAEEVFGVDGIEGGLKEVRDGIADVLVTTYGLAHRMGIDADADLEAVNISNMSKFVKGGLLAAESAAFEVSQRLKIVTSYNETAPGIWAITSHSDQFGSDGKSYPKGKLLKPATYREPVLPVPTEQRTNETLETMKADMNGEIEG